MKLHETRRIERAVLAQVVHGRMPAEEAADSLLELRRLADTADIEVSAQLTQNRDKPDGATLLGAGKVRDLLALIQQTQSGAALFDNELNAVQAYNLEKALGVHVMDRTEVILRIFARRARSAEAQVQVELAQLQFLLSRIPTLETQQRFKGGIGMKGPGESHLQLRNAPMRRRVAELKRRLAGIQARQTGQHRAKRPWPLVALVGYTNAGKSTLLNALTDADAYVDDRLFATLDTKTRKAWLAPSRQVLLTDTVGFIRNLPHTLVASFRATLNIAAQADLLLMVVDAAYPRLADHLAVSERTLQEIGAGQTPRLLVLNKCDRGSADTAMLHIAEQRPQAIPVSARTGYGLDLLKRAMIEELQSCCTLWQLPSAISLT